ncbi:hypothetical protein SNK03_010804 [Fusarium graminearum]|uniref:hypothetical protein n=1 Tax=Gibberella zeae (strain ATCC MYA-4620 / CBS 123657 / FGSC 9075 / NRRL 31084 / PH-1) TaxID=229533 RepID=UPI000023EFAB|nr:hypothetical protein FGSG_04903 [Fusarium graminearum PH-1]ESU10796.1 hypothetical protein FGSG_04903 [Fusarium graminearum PH-1]|eukprot:XP_011323372.1 hypothetical protein FGSG_04903 [Fusarium graminearum PH-1]
MALRTSLSRPVPLLATLTASAIGVSILSKMMFSTASAESPSPQKIFSGAFASVKLPLHSSEYESHDTKRLRFKLPQETAVTGLPLAYLVHIPPSHHQRDLTTPDEPGYMDLLVKKYPKGQGSTYLHSLQPGDTLSFTSLPLKPAWKTNNFPHITLIAGGCGITPLFNLAQGILRDPAEKTRMTFIFGARSDEDVLLKKELDGFAKEFPERFEVKYTALLEEVLGGVGRDTKVFVCGPKEMEKALVGGRGVLKEIGFEKSQIHTF